MDPLCSYDDDCELIFKLLSLSYYRGPLSEGVSLLQVLNFTFLLYKI